MKILQPLNIPIRIFLGIIVAGFSGCVAQVFSPEEAPYYEVKPAQTPMYRFGPMQNTPPDAWLREGTVIQVLRREFGYSFVKLDDNRFGYLANLDIEPTEAPEIPKGIAVTPDTDAEVAALPLWKPERARVLTRPVPVVDDSVLPEPDLDATPEDSPELL